jgi:hypothetical protein
VSQPAGAPNALIHAQSPYLQQHAHNPVAWVEWSGAAFAEARRRDVPVLVSIGYSTCHWCHVMAHECFEDAETAALMNALFVNIKVDREEHPEVDEIYMDAVQALTGHGGWPLNAVVDHDGRPFFAGTYFPREQWRSLVQQLSDVWQRDRPRVHATAQRLTDHLLLMAESTGDQAALPGDVWERLDASLERTWDGADPGFSGRPKFPPSQLLEVLVRRAGDGAAQDGRRMGEAVLEAMQDAGIHDRVGGGFHRYSVEETWRVPHFEKMLYDNAQLIGDYAVAGALLGRADFTRTATNAADYLLRDMRVYDDGGAFVGYASAEDADDPGGEGSFYAWSPDQLRAALPADAAEALIAAWDVAPGVAHRGPSGHMEPVTSHIPQPRRAALAELAPGGDAQALRASWERWLPTLREARSSRPRPGRDDKVLTDLNGLALRAFALLARHTGEARFVAAARELAEVLSRRVTAAGLVRMPGRPAFVTDYGHLLMGLTDAYGLLGDPGLVALAERVAAEAIERLAAPDGGFYTTPAGRGDLIRRSREHTDNAYPSGLHGLAVGFGRLFALTGDERWRVAQDGILTVQAPIVAQAPTACATLLLAWLERTSTMTVVVAGQGEATDALLATARASTRAGLQVVPVAGHEGLPWSILDGRRELSAPEALVCIGDACLLPARTPDELRERLASA